MSDWAEARNRSCCSLISLSFSIMFHWFLCFVVKHDALVILYRIRSHIRCIIIEDVAFYFILPYWSLARVDASKLGNNIGHSKWWRSPHMLIFMPAEFVTMRDWTTGQDIINITKKGNEKRKILCIGSLGLSNNCTVLHHHTSILEHFQVALASSKWNLSTFLLLAFSSGLLSIGPSHLTFRVWSN